MRVGGVAMGKSVARALDARQARELIWDEVLRLVVPGAALLSYGLVHLADQAGWSFHYTILALALLFLVAATWVLLGVRRFLALIALLAGTSVLLGLVGWWWGSSPILFCLAIIPAGLATLLWGRAWGAGISALASAALWYFSGLAAWRESAAWFAALLVIWSVQALFWAADRAVQQAVSWALAPYEQMRQLLEQARDQRLELKQTQQDLVQANVQLERLSERLAAMRLLAEPTDDGTV